MHTKIALGLILFLSSTCLLGFDQRLFSEDTYIIQEAINLCSNINHKDRLGSTALMKAVILNCIKTIKLLLINKKININATNNKRWSALMLVVTCDNLEIAEILIKAKANLNIQNNKGQTALILSMIFNRDDIAKLLIHSGADLNIQDEDGYTALMYAEKYGYTEIISLIKNRINLEKPFIKAAKESDIQDFKSLIEQGVNINARDENGFTALMRVAQAFVWSAPPYSQEIENELKVKIEMLEMLLKIKDLDYNIKDNVMGWTALQWAQESKNEQAIKLLQAKETN